jgi:hypothetical protein
MLSVVVAATTEKARVAVTLVVVVAVAVVAVVVATGTLWPSPALQLLQSLEMCVQLNGGMPVAW